MLSLTPRTTVLARRRCFPVTSARSVPRPLLFAAQAPWRTFDGAVLPVHVRWLRVSATSCANKGGKHHPELADDEHVLAPLINRANETFTKQPLESAAAFVLTDMVSVVGCYALLHVCGVTLPADFALAFVMSRPLRRLRLPLDIAAAAAIARVFPILTRVKLSTLVSSASTKLSPSSPLAWLRSRPAAVSATFSIAAMLDKYGVAYMMGSRVMGLVVVSGLYVAIVNGVDVAGFLERNGWSDFGNSAGLWAGAVVAASLLYPVSVGAVPFVASAVGRLSSRFKL